MYSHQVTEEFLGLVEIYGSKGAEALFNLTCDVLKHKGIDIKQMRFNGVDGTNTMKGERSELQRRFRCEVPHTKNINCRNHKLALVFVHLLPNFKALQNVDSVLLSSWKVFNRAKMEYLGKLKKTLGRKNSLKPLQPGGCYKARHLKG